MKRLSWLPAVVVAIAAFLTGTAWAMSSPVGSSPDDSYHLASIWCGDPDESDEHCRELGVQDDGARVVRVPPLVASGHCYAMNPAASAECQEEVRRQGWTDTAAVDNGAYPGGFYRVMNLFVGDSVPQSVLVMRLVNVFLGTALLAAVALASGPELRRILVYATTVALIPLGWFLLASVNPSSWALIGVMGYAFALQGLLSAPSRRRGVVLAGAAVLGAAMAISARGDSAVHVGIVTVALLVLNWRDWRQEWRSLVVPAAVCLAAAVAVLTSAQVANVAEASAETDRTAGVAALSLLLDWPALISGMFGYAFGLGWLDTPVHAVTAFPVSLVFGFLVLTGLGEMSRRKATAVLVVLVPMLGLPLMTLYRARLIVGEGVQPRYLLPLLPALLAILLTCRTADRAIRLTRLQGVVMLVGLTSANAAALHVNMRRYVIGMDEGLVFDDLEWWWAWAPHPYWFIALGSLAFLVFALPLVTLSGADRPVPPPTAPTTAGRAGRTEGGDLPTDPAVDPGTNAVPVPDRGTPAPAAIHEVERTSP